MSRAAVSLKGHASQRASSAKRREESGRHGASSRSYISLDTIGFIEDVTPEAARLLRRSRDSLLRTPFATLVCEEYRRLWLTHFLTYRRPGRQGKTRLVLDVGGSKRTVDVFTDSTVSPPALRLNVTIQESVPAQHEKSRISELQSNLLGHIYDFVVAVDRKGFVSFTNRPILERLPEQVIGTSFYDYLRPYDSKRFRMAIDQAFACGASTDFTNEGLACFPPDTHFRVRVKPLPIKLNAKRSKMETEAVLIVFADITDQQRAEEELNRIHHNAQRVARRANLIREEERRRLSSELHDQFGQTLTALKIDLYLVKQSGNNRQRTQSALKSAETAVDHLMNLVRALSAELRPPLLDELGLVAALQYQLQVFQKRTGIRSTFTTRTEKVVTSPEIALGIFRVFQESLTNIIRHSHASHVEVGLDVHRGWLFLTVSDNGRGITEEEVYSPRSLGLVGMRERAEQLGGEIQIRNGSTEGTIVLLESPLSAQRSRPARKGA
jgi:signal transduction histidine kinase